jgi:hypothetical protein
MKKEEVIYRCARCDRTVKSHVGADALFCCNEKMIPEPLAQCTSAPNPEMARNTDEDEPCNDGRGTEI